MNTSVPTIGQACSKTKLANYRGQVDFYPHFPWNTPKSICCVHVAPAHSSRCVAPKYACHSVQNKLKHIRPHISPSLWKRDVVKQTYEKRASRGSASETCHSILISEDMG